LILIVVSEDKIKCNGKLIRGQKSQAREKEYK
jgi:hypothetical protein